MDLGLWSICDLSNKIYTDSYISYPPSTKVVCHIFLANLCLSPHLGGTLGFSAGIRQVQNRLVQTLSNSDKKQRAHRSVAVRCFERFRAIRPDLPTNPRANKLIRRIVVVRGQLVPMLR